MSTTYIRQTDSGDGVIRQKILGDTTSKHVISEVDELVRGRLGGRKPNTTNGNRIEVVNGSEELNVRIGTVYPSARAACREIGLPLHSLTVAFHRAQTDTVTLNGITFKKCPRD